VSHGGKSNVRALKSGGSEGGEFRSPFMRPFRPLYRRFDCEPASIASEARLTSASETCCHPKIGLTLEPIPGFMLNAEGEDRAIG
jgi:hypothetical protein